MIGRRVPADENGWLTQPLEPGDYARVDPKRMHDGSEIRIEAFRASYWQYRCPNGHGGCLDPKIHTITEHEDGSITVSPSIRITDSEDREMWHGFLEHGVWRSC